MTTGSPLSLADALAGAPRGSGGKPCPVSLAMDALSADDAATFAGALGNMAFTERQLLAGLAAVNITVTAAAIPRHRRRMCRCFA